MVKFEDISTLIDTLREHELSAKNEAYERSSVGDCDGESYYYGKGAGLNVAVAALYDLLEKK